MALVKNNRDPLLFQRRKPLFVGQFPSFFLFLIPLTVLVKSQSELLYRRHDYLVSVIFRDQPVYQRLGICIFLHAAFLKFIKFLSCLSVKVFPVHDKQAFCDMGIVFQQGGRLKRGKRLSAASRMPDIAVSPVLLNAVHDRFDRINLIRPHDHHFPFTCDQHHKFAD